METATTQVTPHTPTTIDHIVDTAIASIAGQILLSRGPCVDILLDLYLATDDIGLRWSIADRLVEIRFLNAVDASEFRANLSAIAGLASSHASTETDWTLAALTELAIQRAA